MFLFVFLKASNHLGSVSIVLFVLFIAEQSLGFEGRVVNAVLGTERVKLVSEGGGVGWGVSQGCPKGVPFSCGVFH